MKMLILSGKQGSGKTTLTNLVNQRWQGQDKYNRVFIFKFADVLYEMHDAIISILKRYVKPKDQVKDGNLLQLLGTEWGRKTLNENIWVEILKARIALFKKNNNHVLNKTLVIIDDCRFENEFDAFPEALKVRLECDQEIRRSRCSMWRDKTEHPSEVGLDKYSEDEKFDWYLNTGKLEVDMCVDQIMRELDLK